MKRIILNTLYTLLVGVFGITTLMLYVAYRPDGVAQLDRYCLAPLGIHVDRFEGNLYEGFALYGVKGENFDAQSMKLEYNLTQILQGSHVIDTVRVDGLRIELDDFLGGGSSSSSSSSVLPIFRFKNIDLTNVQVISSYPVELDVHARNGRLKGSQVSFPFFEAAIKVKHASVAIHAQVRDNVLIGSALLYPNQKTLGPALAKVTKLPRVLPVNIHSISATGVDLSTKTPFLGLSADPTTKLEQVRLRLVYQYKNKFLDVDTDYMLTRGEHRMKTHELVHYAFNGDVTTHIDGEISSPIALPFHHLSADVSKSAQGLQVNLTTPIGKVALSSVDYDRFSWDVHMRDENLSFVPNAPEYLRTPLSIASVGSYQMTQQRLDANLSIDHAHLGLDANLSFHQDQRSLHARMHLPKEAPMWASMHYKPPEWIDLNASQYDGRAHVALVGEELDVHMDANDSYLEAQGDLLGVRLHAKALLGEEMWLEASIPSALTLASHFKTMDFQENEFYDAGIELKTHLFLKDHFSAEGNITLPWYALVLDSQHAFGGVNNVIDFHYADKKITLDRYDFALLDRRLYNTQPSHLHLDAQNNLIIDDISFYDMLHLHGGVYSAGNVELFVDSDNLYYQGEEGELNASVHVHYTRDAQARQNVEGEVMLTHALLTKLPSIPIQTMDSDIVIVQDVRPPSTSYMDMNIHIGSTTPLRYVSDMVEVGMVPNLTLWKRETDAMQIVGVVAIPSGVAKVLDKHFDIRTSAIYFDGNTPINPYLNLLVEYEIDYKKIFINVTNTLSAPALLFTSNPIMTQNDIMSYILFGEPSNQALKSTSASDSSTNESTNLLGAGLKGIINQTTKLNIDTINITTTSTGGTGFEIGAKINKRTRVIYKNDTISSVIVQYKLNPFVRLDADVNALGQGGKAIYTIDLHDVLPHNDDPPAP